MKELICIICPRGCHLTIDESNDYAVSGNHCPRGIPYAQAEVREPKRVLTTTVCTDSKIFPRCPVKTEQAIPKDVLFQAMEEINHVCLPLPVKCGEVVIANICQTGVDVIATKDLT